MSGDVMFDAVSTENRLLADEDIVTRVLHGEIAMFEILMRRYNQRLYRIARAILRNDTEAEDTVQETYVKVYSHLAQFSGKAKFSSWLIRIGVHEALLRLRRSKRLSDIHSVEDMEVRMVQLGLRAENPENEQLRREMADILQSAIESLPEKYRLVFLLREVENMNTQETAESLGLGEEAVKTRLFRARAQLRKEIRSRTSDALESVYHFAGDRCDRIVANVMRQITDMQPAKS